MDNLVAIAERFNPSGKIIKVREFGSGNVNNTFLVTGESKSEKKFILQRINTQVFRHPELIMQNMGIVSDHISRRLQNFPLDPGRRWEVVRVLWTREGQDHWLDSDGLFWRAISFVEGSQSFDTIKTIDHAREVGHALGMFHALVSDLPHERLADTLEGFHVTPLYLAHYDEVLAQHNREIDPSEENYCKQFVRERKGWANVLETAKEKGRLALRPIHGDPKINNILMDDATGQAISIVDLDTVKPGLVHYDIGDCLRSGCNLLGEEAEQWEKVHFELDICRAILKGYVSTARTFLTENDYDYIYEAIRLIAFELGVRFFTDYLEGNVYFKVNRPKHNLARALVQFKLTESIEFQETAIRSIVKDMR